MASQNSSGVRPLDFPSGSNWGPKELEAVRFALEHEEQEFETFDCVVTLSNANVRVQDRLSSVFAMPVESLLDDGITEPYIEHRRFYERLAAVLKPKALPDTPSKSLNRSEIRHNTSSPFTNEGQPKTPTAVPSDFGSPESSPAAGVSKRKIRTRTTTTPPSRELGRAISTSPERAPTESPPGYMVDEALPVIPGGEHGVSSEKPLLASHSSSGQFYPAFNDDRTSFKLDREPGTSSSQTSSFRSLSSPSLPSESVPYSDADVLEDEIVELFFQFLVSICAEHKKTDGISFITDHGKDLVVIIDGEIVHTRPDLTVSVTLSGKTVPIPILDYEVRASSQLCFSIITAAGQTIVRKAKVCAKGQRNAWPLFQSKGQS